MFQIGTNPLKSPNDVDDKFYTSETKFKTNASDEHSLFLLERPDSDLSYSLVND